MAELIAHHESLEDMAATLASCTDAELVGSWLAQFAASDVLLELRRRGITAENLDSILREIGIGMEATIALANRRAVSLPVLRSRPLGG